MLPVDARLALHWQKLARDSSRLPGSSGESRRAAQQLD